MGDKNQIIYAKSIFPKPTGSVLEIGSKDHGNTASLRGIYKDVEYVGTDLEDGKNVDIVCDLEKTVRPFDGKTFDLVLCFSTLEHVAKPWIVARNISKLVADGGHICFSAPWVWRYHAYPDDYFRYSPSAIRSLFPDFHFFDVQLSTMAENDFWQWVPEDKKKSDTARCITSPAGGKQKKNFLPYMNLYMSGVKNA